MVFSDNVMSKIDQTQDLGYSSWQEKGITLADVLQKLKDDLAMQLAVLADAKRAVQHLQVAIAAIERDEAESKRQVKHQRPTSKRGYLSNAVIEALREGIGNVSLITKRVKQQGIETTQQSVSNAIQRLQIKRKIQFDQKLRRWTLATNTGSLEDGIANKVLAPEMQSGAMNGGSHPLSPLTGFEGPTDRR